MRFVRLIGIALTSLAAASAALAQGYPNKPIRLIIPQGASGGADIVARTMSDGLHQRLGQPVIVENRPGGNESIGPGAVAMSAPDGYTLGIISATHSINQTSAGIRLAFDPQGFVPIAPMMSVPMIVMVNSSIPANDIRSLVALSKANPGKFNYGSAGPNTFAGMATEWFVRVSGADFTGVTYGTKGILQGLVANDIQMAFGGYAAASPILQTGKAKVVAVTSAQRTARLPDVPTVAETYPGFSVVPWYGFVAPKGTPPEVVARLNKAIGETITELRPRLLELGDEPMVMTPTEFQEFLKKDLKDWQKIVEAATVATK